jgi:glycosyl transferase family 25
VVLVRYIAMDSEIERIAFMEEWLSGTGVDFVRASGVKVSDLDSVSEYLSAKRIARFGYDLTASEVGCFLAHRNCWIECSAGTHPMLIMEGDIRLGKGIDFHHLLRQLIEVSEKFDIVRLHGLFEHNEFSRRRLVELADNLNLYQCLGDPMGAGSYLLTPTAAATLLNKSGSFFQPVDVFLGSTWLHRLRFRTLKPYPFEAMDFESEIGERRRPKQGVLERLSIEGHRFTDDLKRILYMPLDFFR